MSAPELDLTEAVEAAARTLYEAQRASVSAADPMISLVGVPWDQAPAIVQYEWRETVTPLITATAPLIAQQAREQAAQEIEAYADATWDLVDSNNGARLAFEEIARITRGGTR